MSSKKEQDWSSHRLQGEVKEAVTKFFDTVLDFSEVAVGDEKRYRALRSKILRHGNDTIRRISANIGSNYEVMFKGLLEEEVRFSGQTARGGKDNK